jgi:hypothetical protein
MTVVAKGRYAPDRRHSKNIVLLAEDPERVVRANHILDVRRIAPALRYFWDPLRLVQSGPGVLRLGIQVVLGGLGRG